MAKRKVARRAPTDVREPRDKVMFGTPHGGPGSFQPEFIKSLVFMLVHDAHTGRRIVDGGAYLQYGTTNIPLGRNEIVREFLQLPGIDWLLFVDTDQSFERDLMERMIASAKEADTLILGALVFSYQKGDAQQIVPTMWHLSDDDPPRVGRIMRVPDQKHVTCAATGTGCVLVHRKVFEAVRDYVPAGTDKSYGETSWPWFRYSEWESEAGPDIMGEDITFFLRATAAGFPTVVDTTIEVGHIKRGNIGRQEYELQQVAESFPKHVVIPVKGKHDLTRSLVDELLDQGEADCIWIMDNGSDSDPYVDDRVEVIPAAGKNIHEMWNEGIRLAASEAGPRVDVAVLNNDLRVGPEFLTRLAEALRHHPRVLAVSPNYDRRPVGDGFQQVHGICAGRYDGTGGLAGFAFMIRGEAWTANALSFDEELAWWYGDNDLCLQMEELQGVYGIATSAECEHLDGGTANWDSPEWKPILAEDERRFREKWSVS